MTKCKICDGGDIANYFEGEDKVFKCSKCGIGFLNPSLVKLDYPDYYEEASNYTAIVNDENRLKIISDNANSQLDFIEKHIDLEGGSLLDIGTHTGIFIREAIKRGFKAEGVEPNKTVVEWAKTRGIPVINGGIESYDSGKTYDIITLFHVLEHLDNPVENLSKIGKWLNRDGYLVLEVPNSDSFLAKLDGVSWKYIAFEHLYYFSEDSLVRLLESSGYSVIASLRRNFELNELNIRKLFRYLVGGHISRNRFQEKFALNRQVTIKKERSLFKRIIVKCMVVLIHMLHREDHIMIIAQKTKI